MTKLAQINSSTNKEIENMALFLPNGHQLDAPSLDDLCNQYCDSLWNFLQIGLENSALLQASSLTVTQSENITRFRKVALLALSHLPLRNREVIELVCFHGYSVAEAAMIVDCAVGVAEIRLSYARNKINAAVKNDFKKALT